MSRLGSPTTNDYAPLLRTAWLRLQRRPKWRHPLVEERPPEIAPSAGIVVPVGRLETGASPLKVPPGCKWAGQGAGPGPRERGQNWDPHLPW